MISFFPCCCARWACNGFILSLFSRLSTIHSTQWIYVYAWRSGWSTSRSELINVFSVQRCSGVFYEKGVFLGAVDCSLPVIMMSRKTTTALFSFPNPANDLWMLFGGLATHDPKTLPKELVNECHYWEIIAFGQWEQKLQKNGKKKWKNKSSCIILN